MIENLILLLGPQELTFLVIILIILLIWGPNQLPKLARALGEAKKEFQKAQKENDEEETKKE
ncbi:MAG TPA: hypothetical protein EYH44_04220 [Thermoprotei archaeon]|nr:hypothetical protein [Thermoprotei archaeon]